MIFKFLIMRGRIKHRGVGNVTIGLVVLNAKIRADSFRVLSIGLMVISEGNPGID